MEQIDISALARMFAIYGHILACCAATTGIVLAHVSALRHDRQMGLGALAAKTVIGAFIILWVTGLWIVGIDTGFDLAVIAGKGKLLAKMT